MDQRKRDEIKQIFQQNKSYYSDERGRGLLRGITRNFPHEWLYICELIQNAIDVGAKRIKMTCNTDSFIFEHDGQPFEYKDIKGICTVGLSSKGVSTIGFMGIGFKSVFTSFEMASISSNEYKFYLRVPCRERTLVKERDWVGALLPIWDDQLAYPSEGMTTKIELTDRISHYSPVEHISKIWQKDRSILPMLADRGIEHIELNGDVWKLSRTALNDTKSAGNLLTATHFETEEKERWVLFQRDYFPSEQAKQEFLAHRDLQVTEEEEQRYLAEMKNPRRVAVFCGVDEEGGPIIQATGYAYAVMPTDIQLPFPCHVQADWLLMNSRTQMVNIEERTWHDEIAIQVPYLLSAMIDWFINKIEDPKNIKNVLRLIPDLTQELTDPVGRWWLRQIRPGLEDALAECSFLPVYDDDGKVRFVAPKQAAILPEELFDFEMNPTYNPWKLFKNSVVARRLLSDSVTKSLILLQFLDEIKQDSFNGLWNGKDTESWFDSLPNETKYVALYDMWSALGFLSLRMSITELIIIPNQEGGWTSPYGMNLMTEEYWGTFNKQPWLQDKLLKIAGNPARLVDIKIQMQLYRLRDNAKKTSGIARGFELFVQKMNTLMADTLLKMYWSECEIDDVHEHEFIIRLTRYVVANLKNRSSLIQKVIAIDAEGRKGIFPISQTVLADPFTSQYRRSLFLDHPVVASDYCIDGDGEISEEQWKDFFIKHPTPPQGAFYLKEIIKSFRVNFHKDCISLQELIQRDKLPPIRKGFYCTKYQGRIEVSNEFYLFLDRDLPDEWKQAVVNTETVEVAVSWMCENLSLFKQLHPLLLYIPYGSSQLVQEYLHLVPAWKKTLMTTAWVPVKGHSCLYKPDEVLPAYDELRPESPVADIPRDLLSILTEQGIVFGSSIPNAPSVDRLKKQGKSLSLSDLYTLLKEAVEEAKQSDEVKNYLIRVLLEESILPKKDGGRTNIKYVVIHKGERSDLNGRIVSLSDFPDGSIEVRIYSLIQELFTLPQGVTGEIALLFLREVWEKMPPADEVRRVMPMAYQYVKEQVEHDPSFQIIWQQARSVCKVFVRGSGWRSPHEVYLNNVSVLTEPELLKMFLVATPGHLGHTLEQQKEIATFIGLPWLSERINIKHQPVNPMQFSSFRQKHMQMLWSTIQEILLFTDDEESLLEDWDSKIPGLFQCASVERVITDVILNQQISRDQKRAVFEKNSFYVSGKPYEFASELTEEIMKYFRISNRSDSFGKMKNLWTRVSVALTQIDNPKEFVDVIRQMRSDYHLDIQSGHVASLQSSDWPDSMQQSVQEAAVSDESPIESEWNNPSLVIDEKSEQVATDVPPVTSYPSSDNREFQTIYYKKSEKQEGKMKNHVAPKFISGKKEANSLSLMAPGKKFTVNHRKLREKNMACLFESYLAGLVIPQREGETESKKEGDSLYRKAAMEYEKMNGRFPKEMPDSQPGYDIESYDSSGNLVRLIEVKGKGTVWADDEIVSISRKQAETFMHKHDECWLYIVERIGDKAFRVKPINNPIKKAKSFDFSARLWHFAVQHEELVLLEDNKYPDPSEFNFD